MTSDTPPAGPSAGTAMAAPPACDCRQRAERAEAELAALNARREHVRQHVRDGVASGNFDLDVSNDLLTALDLEPLPRYWTVNLLVTLTLTVAAGSVGEAFDTARDTVDTLLGPSDVDADFDITDVADASEAIPGDLADESAETAVRA